MLKQNKGLLILTSILILLPIATGLLLWNRLPDEIPTHWNAAGEVDGWSSKPMSVFALPCFILAVHWFCTLATCTDPKNKNHTPKMLKLVLWICPVMSILTGTLIYCFAMGIHLDVTVIMPVLMGLMFVFIGNYLPKCKQNYTIGIKVVWALEDSANWNATHRFAGKLWMAGGILIIACSLIFREAIVPFFFAGVLIMALAPTLYSYLYYKRHKTA